MEQVWEPGVVAMLSSRVRHTIAEIRRLIHVVVPFLLIFTSPGCAIVHIPANEAMAKANLYTLQIALERHAIDNSGLYPENIEVLFDKGYLESLPANPFRSNYEMEEVLYGSKNFEGNFTYIPVKEYAGVISYFLIGYGSRRTEGEKL